MSIIPAILESSYDEIESKVESVIDDAEKVHIDICDGLLVDRKTWPYSQSSNNRIEDNFQIKKILNEEIGLPNWESINYEFDLMIQNPDMTQDIWGRIGANTLIIHPKSFKDESNVLDFIHNMNSYMIDTILAVTYDEYFTYENMILDLIKRELIKSLQIMTIKVIGAQGQKFDERCVALIEKIKNENPDIFIRVDGGVNDKTITRLIDVKVDEFVIGSAIFSEGNARENLNYFRDLC